MRILHPHDYRTMPWRNGGGTTMEIAIHPESSGFSGVPFQWRVSIADVATNGPFSLFPGYDRHIMVIAGAGMQLDAGPRGVIVLGRPFIPVSFSGDWEITGKLTNGPIRDFNLMASHAETRSSLSCDLFSDARQFSAGDGFVLLHVLEGKAAAAGQPVTAGDTLYLAHGERIELVPSGSVRLAHCRIAA